MVDYLERRSRLSSVCAGGILLGSLLFSEGRVFSSSLFDVLIIFSPVSS